MFLGEYFVQQYTMVKKEEYTNMKRWILLLVSICLCLVSGCTKKNIISNNNEKYADLPVPVGGIVWEQVWDDFDEIYSDLDAYPFAETVNGGFYPDENMLKFFLLLNTTISDEEAEKYATTVIKGFNDLIAQQNSDYAPSSENSYGGSVDQYGIYVLVSPDSTKDDSTTWILEDTIPAGEYRPVSASGGE